MCYFSPTTTFKLLLAAITVRVNLRYCRALNYVQWNSYMGSSCAVGLLTLDFSLLTSGFLIVTVSEGVVLTVLLWRAMVPLCLC